MAGQTITLKLVDCTSSRGQPQKRIKIENCGNELKVRAHNLLWKNVRFQGRIIHMMAKAKTSTADITFPADPDQPIRITCKADGISAMSRLDGVDRTVLGHLRPMFPQLGVAVLETSILHPSNREGVFDEFLLLQRCIDDLLELRTHTMPPEIPPEIPPEDPAPVAQWQDEAYQDEQDLGNLSDAQCKEFGIVHGYNKQNLGSNGNFKPLDNRSAVDERNVGIGCAPSVGNNSVACSSRNVGYTATNDGCYSNYNTPQVPNLYGNQNTNTSVMNSIRPSAGGSSNYSMPHAVFHTRGGPPIINYSMPRPVFHTRGGSSVPPDRSSALHHGTIVVGDDSYCVEPRDGYGSPVTYRFGLGTHNPGSNHDVGMHTGVHRYRGDHDAGPIQMNNVAIGPQPPWQQPEQQQPIQQQQQPMQQQQQPMQQQQQPIQQHQQPIQQHQQPMQQQQHPQQQQQSPAQPKQVHNPLNAATPRQFEDHHKPRTPVRLDERASQRLTQQQSPAVRAGNQQDIVIAASSSSASATVTGTADPVDNLPSGSVPDGSATQCWRPARPEYKASRRSRPGLYSSADMHTGDTDDEDTETDEGDEDDELPTIGSVKTKQRAIPKEVLKQRARKLSAPAAGLPKLTANQERFQMDINKNIQKNLDKIESSVKLIQNAIFPAVRNPNIGPAGDVATPGGRGMKRAHSATATATVTLAEDQDVIVEDVYRPEVIDLVVTPLPRPILPKVTFVDDPPPPMGPLTPQRRAPPPPQAPQTPPRQVPPPPPAPKKKTAEDVLEERTERVCMLFPKAEPTFVKQQLRFAVHDDPETVVCNYLLEHPGHPKRPSGKTPAATNDTTVVNGGGDAASLIQSTIMSPQAPSIDYYKDYNKVNPPSDYIDQTITLLKAEFLKVSVGDIRSVCNAFSYHYAPTRKFFIDVFRENGYTLNETHKVIGSQGIKVLMSNIDLPFTSHLKTLPVKSDSVPVRFKETGIKILKCGRARPTLSPPCSQLLDELNFIIRLNNAETETHDAEMAQTLNEEQYEEEGQAIECGCCYGDCPFDKMVQCYEGHLFCQSCLQCYVKEAVYGQGKSKLECLSDGCEAGFPKSELLRAVPSTVIDKFEEKEQEQSLNLADMSDLVRCPHCDYAAVLDPSIKVFKCHNKECGKETCRHCKEDWEEHFGIPCKEMEKKDETKLRLQFEEKMTMAKIRTCARCKAGFTKSDGCNKMSCPCGAKMCYICRKPNIDYNHFCNHARDPGKKCTKCTNCSLWTNPEEDDERAVLEIRKEAQQARQAQGFADDKLIGAPDEAEPKAKKARKN